MPYVESLASLNSLNTISAGGAADYTVQAAATITLSVALMTLSIISEAILLLIGFALAWSLPTFADITVAMVSFIGPASMTAEETKRPDKTIPKSTFALIVAVILAGMLLAVLALGLSPIKYDKIDAHFWL